MVNTQPSKTAAAGQNGNGRGTPIKVPQRTYKLVPAGMHVGRCATVADIGTQPSKYGKKPKVVFTFELPNEQVVFVEERGEEPFHLSLVCTNSLGERASLYRHIIAWQGKGAIERLRDDLGQLVGEPCMLNVIHETRENGETREKIIGVTPVPKGMAVPPQISPGLTYSVADGVAGGRYDKLPVWIQKMVMKSEEIDGEHPSKTEMIERNVSQATANAQAKQFDEDEMNRELAALTH